MNPGDTVKLSAAGLRALRWRGVTNEEARGSIMPRNSHTYQGCERVRWDHRKVTSQVTRDFIEVVT